MVLVCISELLISCEFASSFLSQFDGLKLVIVRKFTTILELMKYLYKVIVTPMACLDKKRKE